MLETHASGTVLRAISSVCYGTSDMSIIHNGTIFSRVLCPKISTGLEKLAPTGWHGWHVFATLQGTPLPPVKTTYLGMLDNLPL